MPTAATPSPIDARFRKAAAQSPQKTALFIDGRRFSYAELARDVDALSRGLAAAGLAAGEHVGLVLPNCAPFVVVLLAAARLGLVLVPQSPGLSAEAIDSTFDAADVRHLIAWHGLAGQIDGGRRTGAKIVVGATADGWTAYSALLDGPARDATTAPSLPAEHPYLLILTSGSTGQPKPIILSQTTKVLRAEAAGRLYGVTTSDVTLAATPLYHSLAQRLVLMPLLTGGTSVVLGHFTPTTWIDAVHRHGVTFSIAVSSQLKAILTQTDRLTDQLRSLRCLVSSSALLDDEAKAKLIGLLDCDFHECYGASEIAIATNLSPAAARQKLGSVGRAIPGVDVAILGEDGRLAPTGSPGEIICRTPMRYSGYYRQPETTAAAQWHDHFRTGDLGRMDADGFLYFLGRIKDIIITGGVNVYPKDIEDVILSHPAVEECAAIPLADDGLGEVVGVVVAFKNSEQPPALRDLQRLCMQHLGDYQQPRRFITLPILPKNAMGKLDKLALRNTYSSPRQPE
ncbi:MAG: acyl--CoA ligase [Rhodocyclales bacterium]|nr:acyl--CoA ligase [Rhodocyclales bacterium]